MLTSLKDFFAWIISSCCILFNLGRQRALENDNQAVLIQMEPISQSDREELDINNTVAPQAATATGNDAEAQSAEDEDISSFLDASQALELESIDTISMDRYSLSSAVSSISSNSLTQKPIEFDFITNKRSYKIGRAHV